MKNIAIFASGSGTNAEVIIQYFSNRKSAKVSLVLSNKPEAMVLKRAENHKIESVIFEHDDLYINGKVLQYLEYYKIDLVVLAGFLWLIPEDIIKRYEGYIVNIHPALLPLYGGKGMYGDAVHRSVIANGDEESGITIHHVNSLYDNGDIILQVRCRVDPSDTPESLAAKIHDLEHRYYPEVIEELVLQSEQQGLIKGM
jgi:phosphoribosylglycinamide formyltransferase 1